MHKTFSLHIAFWVVGLFLLVAPQNSLASELSFKIVPSVGDGAVALEVRINPEGKNLNVVEGGVSFGGFGSNDLSVEVNKEGSVFTMWPTEPAYNKADKMISFVGGTPDGLKEEGLLFTIRLFSTVAGKLDVSWSGVKTYLNDGKGTEEATRVKSVSLNLDKKDLKGTTEEKDIQVSKDMKIDTVFAGFNITKNVRILLLIIILFSAIFYGYKKFIKS